MNNTSGSSETSDRIAKLQASAARRQQKLQEKKEAKKEKEPFMVHVHSQRNGKPHVELVDPESDHFGDIIDSMITPMSSQHLEQVNAALAEQGARVNPETYVLEGLKQEKSDCCPGCCPGRREDGPSGGEEGASNDKKNPKKDDSKEKEFWRKAFGQKAKGPATSQKK